MSISKNCRHRVIGLKEGKTPINIIKEFTKHCPSKIITPELENYSILFDQDTDATAQENSQKLSSQIIIDKITALTENTTKKDRQIVEKEAKQSKLIKEYNDCINSIKKNIKDKIAQLSINSKEADINAVSTYADNYDLLKEFTKKHEKLKITIIEKLKVDTDDSIIQSLKEPSNNFGLGDLFRKAVLKINIYKKLEKLEKTINLEEAKTIISNIMNLIDDKIDSFPKEEQPQLTNIKETIEKMQDPILYRVDASTFIQNICYPLCESKCETKKNIIKNQILESPESIQELLKCMSDCKLTHEERQSCEFNCAKDKGKEILQIHYLRTSCNLHCDSECMDIKLHDVKAKSQTYYYDLFYKLIRLFPNNSNDLHYQIITCPNLNLNDHINNIQQLTKQKKFDEILEISEITNIEAATVIIHDFLKSLYHDMACLSEEAQNQVITIKTLIIDAQDSILYKVNADEFIQHKCQISHFKFECEENKNKIQEEILIHPQLMQDLNECSNKTKAEQDRYMNDWDYNAKNSQLQYLSTDCNLHCDNAILECTNKIHNQFNHLEPQYFENL